MLCGFLFLLLFYVINCENCNSTAIFTLCIDQETCRECLEVDPCCNWCYDQNFKERRCDIFSNLKKCDQNSIERNQDVRVEKTSDKSFSEVVDLQVGTIQIKPQSFDIFLRKGKPVNVSFTYKQAKNYPLDLYYLGDLSLSMRQNLKIFQAIGKDLSNRLNEVTNNYKLAYGSFMDKPGMPFYFTVDRLKDRPCDDCEKGYLFKHRLSFTKDINEFVNKVKDSKITANMDDLDGALDAIMQILVCKIIGWGPESRKVILLATDSLLHTAGDGILVGAVKRATDKCLLDKNGEHTDPLTYDYPSVAEIHRLLREKKVNIIFAVKDPIKLQYYENLTTTLLRDSAFTGQLEAQSEKILDLIEEGYKNFARQVSFSVNTSHAEHIDVKFFGKCPGSSSMNETSFCYNADEDLVEFIVQLTLKDYPNSKDVLLTDVLLVEEKNINENITLNISYRKGCGCKNYTGNGKICVNGSKECGICYCEKNWTGENCNISCDSDELKNREACKPTNGSICSGNGDCYCGKCMCYPPYTGRHCEDKCPTDKYLNICSKNGHCVNNTCICDSQFDGKDCSCSKLTSSCRLSKDHELCSGRGSCTCNSCKCQDGYSGRYCEMNKNNNNTLCEEYKEHVENATNKIETHNEDVSVTLVDKLGDTEFACQTVTFEGVTRCTITYNYRTPAEGLKGVAVEAMQECTYTASLYGLSTAIIFFVAVVVGGVLALIFWKVNMVRSERAEFKKFETERLLSTNSHRENPIYNNPNRTYINPFNS